MAKPNRRKCDYEGCHEQVEFDLEGQSNRGRYFCRSHAQQVHDCRQPYFKKIDGSAWPSFCGNCDSEDD